jgi:glutamate/aspartate transport system permease protein
VAQRDGRLVEMYVFVAVVYFALCCLLSWLARQLQRRVAIIR